MTKKYSAQIIFDFDIEAKNESLAKHEAYTYAALIRDGYVNQYSRIIVIPKEEIK